MLIGTYSHNDASRCITIFVFKNLQILKLIYANFYRLPINSGNRFIAPNLQLKAVKKFEGVNEVALFNLVYFVPRFEKFYSNVIQGSV